MTETKFVLSMDLGSWICLGLLIWFVISILDADEADAGEDDEEDEVANVIVPAQPGFAVVEVDQERLREAIASLPGVTMSTNMAGHVSYWPVIAWEIEPGELPVAMTTAGRERDYAAIRWPNGQVHDQGGEMYDTVEAYVTALLGQKEDGE